MLKVYNMSQGDTPVGLVDQPFKKAFNTYLGLSDAAPPGYVPIWGRIKAGATPGTASPLTLQRLCANTIVASANLSTLQP